MRASAILFVTLIMATGQAAGQGLRGENGVRSFHWPNGDSFVGEFRGGLPNGRGTMRYADGTTHSGEWVNGCLSKGTQRIAAFTTLKNCPRGAPVPLPQLADR